VSGRRKLAFGVILIVALLLLAATFWSPPGTGAGEGRVLVLDARTGKTLHERTFSGGWVVAALLRDGRIAVAHEDSCPDGEGGATSIWNATLERRLSGGPLDPCAVAKLDPRSLRARYGERSADLGPTFLEGIGVSAPLGAGRIVETLETKGPESWYTALTAVDAKGERLWRRSFGGRRLGVVDARDGTVIVPVTGRYVPGTR
jgi:hypothetical protein